MNEHTITIACDGSRYTETFNGRVVKTENLVTVFPPLNVSDTALSIAAAYGATATAVDHTACRCKL